MKLTLIVLGIGVAGFLVFVATRPDTYVVQRSQRIEAPAEIVFAHLEDFRAWKAWSPWEKVDPGMQRTYSGPVKGVGAGYAWEGNRKVGKGRMTVTEASPPTGLTCRLEFIEPFASVATAGFALEPQGSAVVATWRMDGKNNLMGKAMSVFMDLDRMIGTEFEKGLASLKALAEAEAQKRAAGRTAGLARPA
jgi:Polyketide cyclase / dehydrase and lipid transport